MDLKKTGIFWGSGFGEPSGTPSPRILRSPSPPPIEPLLRLSEIQACAKELITRNESREVVFFKCMWMYFQDKFNIKGTKKNEQGIVYLLAVFSIHIVLTDVHDTGRKAVIKRTQRMFIIT